METLNTNTPETNERYEHHLKFQQAVESMVKPVDREAEWDNDRKVIAESEFDIPLGSLPLVVLADKVRFRIKEVYGNPAERYGEDVGVSNDRVVRSKEYEVTIFDTKRGDDEEAELLCFELGKYDKSFRPANNDLDPDHLTFLQIQDHLLAYDHKDFAEENIVVPSQFFTDSLSAIIAATQKK